MGRIFVVSAPSGAGKTSLVAALIQRFPDLKLSVSTTTRPPRPGEVSGVAYHFIDREAFETQIQQGVFIEYAQVFGHYYGTSAIWLAQQQAAGHDVLLEIDCQGAALIRQRLSSVESIFILPPSLQALKARLRARGQDSEAEISRRVEEALGELSHAREFDHWVVNEVFEQALDQLQAIIVSQPLVSAKNPVERERQLKALLESG